MRKLFDKKLKKASCIKIKEAENQAAREIDLHNNLGRIEPGINEVNSFFLVNQG